MSSEEKKSKVPDKISDILEATIDMEAAKENTLHDIVESISKLGVTNQTNLTRIATQVTAALNGLQNTMFQKLARLGNSLWEEASKRVEK